MKYPRWGGQWFLLLFALGYLGSLHAQSPADASFLSTLGELRDATYSDKVTIVERLSQGGHASTSAVLTALMRGQALFP